MDTSLYPMSPSQTKFSDAEFFGKLDLQRAH